MNGSPVKKPLVATLALLVLWGASFWLSYAHTGRLGIVVALTIASAQAIVLASAFLELGRLRASIRLTALAALVMFAVMFGLVVIDVVERGAG